jgi:ubiquinone/menaquinone biosynthesis C-methylase UbiE
VNKKEFNKFFEAYSKNVDNANAHGFWKLSDMLITQIIKDNIPTESVYKNNIILDAGGGTGRWVCELSKIYDSEFIIYDLSGDMLKKAKENVKKFGVEDRIRLIKGDLKNMRELASNSVDHIISIYSPISFIYEKEKAFAEMFRVLKNKGKLIIMGHGFHNAIASKINNFCANADELKMMDEEQMVKWDKYVPKLNIFSKEILEEDLRQAGFFPEKNYGVPVFVQPGPEDFDPENKKKSRISAALEKKDFFQKVFELEMKYNCRPTIANRGMNIFTVACKN